MIKSLLTNTNHIHCANIIISIDLNSNYIPVLNLTNRTAS